MASGVVEVEGFKGLIHQLAIIGPNKRGGEGSSSF